MKSALVNIGTTLRFFMRLGKPELQKPELRKPELQKPELRQIRRHKSEL